MIERLIDRDPLGKHLFERSSFTRVQLDTLLADRLGRAEGRKLAERISLRETGPVAKAAFLTSLRQAELNVRQSTYSILLSQYLKLLERGSVESLALIGNLLSQTGTPPLNQEQIAKVIQAVEQVVDTLTKPQT